VGLQPSPPRLLQKELYVDPDGQMLLSGRSVQSGSEGQHGLMQYWVVKLHDVDPQGMVVVPLDPPELDVPLEPPELDVPLEPPELDAMPELLATPELADERPLEEETPDDVVVCWLDA
jgi:hypothetical protein